MSEQEPEPEQAPERPRFPALVVAGGPVVGPHAFGNEECRQELQRCERTGTFFGFGAQAELRGRLYKPLYLHTRALVVGNVTPHGPLYRGGWGLGVGLGAYGRWVFARAEYLYFHALGDNTFPMPFGDEDLGTDTWTRHAGVASVGFRKTFKERLAVELWVGPMFGPRSERVFPAQEPDRTLLFTFLAGVNLSYDIMRDWTRR